MAKVPLRKQCVALVLGIAFACSFAPAAPAQANEGRTAASGPTEERMITDNAPGHAGGRLAVALRSEPKTLNPALAEDEPSRDVIRCITADLIHINRESQKTEPALAKSWRVSRDGRQYTLRLRQGVRFSDGQPFTADDVVFTFQVYLDEQIHSPQRDLLVIGGKPLVVT